MSRLRRLGAVLPMTVLVTSASFAQSLTFVEGFGEANANGVRSSGSLPDNFVAEYDRRPLLLTRSQLDFAMDATSIATKQISFHQKNNEDFSYYVSNVTSGRLWFTLDRPAPARWVYDFDRVETFPYAWRYKAKLKNWDTGQVLVNRDERGLDDTLFDGQLSAGAYEMEFATELVGWTGVFGESQTFQLRTDFSIVPEPASPLVFALGTLLLRRRR